MNNARIIEAMIEQLQVEQGKNVEEASVEVERRIKVELDREKEREEIFWHQWARLNWINFDDENTKFFHQTMMQRRARNKILRIKDGNDEWLVAKEDIMSCFAAMSVDLYTANPQIEMDEVLVVVDKVVLPEVNERLFYRIDKEEIK